MSRIRTVVNVKLRPGGTRAPREVLSVPGVVEATRTFPDEGDEELSSLYVLQVEPSRSADVLGRLRADPAVEYAEEAAPRKLLG